MMNQTLPSGTRVVSTVNGVEGEVVNNPNDAAEISIVWEPFDAVYFHTVADLERQGGSIRILGPSMVSDNIKE